MKEVIILGFLVCLNGFSQTTSEMWAKTDTISTETYEFQVPISWRNFEKIMNKGKGPEHFFEASGHGLPVSSNGGPVIISVFLVEMHKSKSLKDAKENVINGYFENHDRVFQKEKNYQEEDFSLSENSEAVILNTRFYRKSKGLNQSRFDLITYSKKHKKAYIFTVSIQYVDETYAFETDNNLTEYAKKLYTTFKWK